MREGVFQDNVPPSQKPKRSFPIVPLPPDGTAPTDDRPVIYNSSSDVQSDCLPSPKLQIDGSDDAAWAEVEAAWADAEDYVGVVIATAFCNAFGWTKPTTNAGPSPTNAGDPVAVGSTASAPVVLNGAKPTELVNNFEQYYLNAPFVCVADS